MSKVQRAFDALFISLFHDLYIKKLQHTKCLILRRCANVSLHDEMHQKRFYLLLTHINMMLFQ